MALLEWWMRRAQRKRLRAVQRGISECMRDPGRIGETALALDVPPNVLREWLHCIDPERHGSARLKLLASGSTIDALTERSAADSIQVPRARQPHAEQMRRMIVALLDSPVAIAKPEVVSRLIVQLADATAGKRAATPRWGAAGDGTACHTRAPAAADRHRSAAIALTAAISDDDPGLGPPSITAIAAMAASVQRAADDDASSEPQRLDRSRLVELLHRLVELLHQLDTRLSTTELAVWSQALSAMARRVPDGDVIVSALAEIALEADDTQRRTLLMEVIRGLADRIDLAVARLDDRGPQDGGERSGVEHGPGDTGAAPGRTATVGDDHLAGSALQIGALLETLDRGTVRMLEARLSLIKSISTASRSEDHRLQGQADVLVVVRTLLEDTAAALAERANLPFDEVSRVLTAISRRALLPFRQIRWCLDQGHPHRSSSTDRGSLAPDADVAWSLLASLSMSWALYKVDQHRASGLLVSHRIAMKHRSAHPQPLAMFTCRLVRRTNDACDRDDAWTHELAAAVASPALRQDPDLAVRLAGSVCENRGTLSWPSALELANSRAAFHLYVDADSASHSEIAVDVRDGHEGTVEILYAAVEQPLSARFRAYFESKDLNGRLSVVCQLIRYSSQWHGSVISITTTDVAFQDASREEELWQNLHQHHE